MLKRILSVLILLNFSASAFALCVRVPDTFPDGWEPFDPTTGISALWNGKINGGGLNMGRTNLASDLVQPIGSVIGNGGPVPMTQYGEFVGFQPEQVLFVCSPEEEGLLFEGFVATKNYMNIAVTDPDVPEFTRTTRVRRVGWRALHMATGKYFTNSWQLRPLTGLDRDIYGRILVKAKNFSDVQMEYIKLRSPTDTEDGPYTGSSTSSFGTFAPYGYVTLISHNQGPNATPYTRIPNCTDGQSFSACNLASTYDEYVPGVISNNNAHLGGDGSGVSSYRGCMIANVTPSVIFSPISVTELNAGGKRTGRIDIEYHCENGAYVGTGVGTNAIGFKVSDAAKNIANNFGFKTAGGTGVTKLFSENYGASGIATGVAIEMLKNDSIGIMNWLTSSSVGGGNINGWYTPGGININPGTEPVKVFNISYDVELSKFTPPSLPADPVTPGIVYATADVLIVVQ